MRATNLPTLFVTWEGVVRLKDVAWLFFALTLPVNSTSLAAEAAAPSVIYGKIDCCYDK
jgi:hypothetical protein